MVWNYGLELWLVTAVWFLVDETQWLTTAAGNPADASAVQNDRRRLWLASAYADNGCNPLCLGCILEQALNRTPVMPSRIPGV